jgi:RNA polymerase sigma factor (sigma-70 family)
VAAVPDPSVADPSEEREREEVRSQIYEAIAHLEGEERQVIALVCFEGMPGRESAAPLGVSKTTALRRLRSAWRRRLRGRLASPTGSARSSRVRATISSRRPIAPASWRCG